MAETAPTDPRPVRATTINSIKSTSAALEENLSRQNSYGLKVHRRVNKNLYDILEVNFRLVEILFDRVVSETAIPEEAVNSARLLLKQINQLRISIKQRAKKSSMKRRFSGIFPSLRTSDLYVDDVKSLDLLSEQLDVLINILNNTQRQEHTILQVRENEAKLTVRTKSRDASSVASHRTSPQPGNPSYEEENAARIIFTRFERPIYRYWMRHLQYSNTRLPNTCDWILENETYQQWRAAPNDLHLDRSKVLWCSGSAGTGKSILASTVVDDLKANLYHVAYFYFGKGLVQNFTDVLGSLLTQIWAANKQRSSFEAETNHKLQEMAIVEWNEQSIERVIPYFTPNIFVVLDGVDKENRDEQETILFRYFIQLLKEKGIKLFLTSRELPGSTTLDQVLHLSLPHASQTGDLQSFARDLIFRSPDTLAYELFMSDKDLLNEVVQLDWVQDHRDDVSFPYIRLVVSTLLRQKNRSQLEEMLRVDDTLELYFNSHDKDVSGISQASVMWLLQSKRPMTISALQEVLALLDSNDTEESYEGISMSMTRYRSENNRRFPNRDRYPTIKFLQHCGKDLFWIDDITRTVALSGDNLFDGINLNRNITSLADMCIYYLSTDALDDLDYKDRDSVAKCAEDHQFLRYACSAWQDHAQRQEISPSMRPKYVELMRSRTRLHTVLAIEAWDRYQNVNSLGWKQLLNEIEGTTAAHIAILCNDSECLEEVLAEVHVRKSSTSMELQKADINAHRPLDLRELIMLAFNRGRRECFDVLYEQYLDFLLDIERKRKFPQEPIHQWQQSDQWGPVFDWFDLLHEMRDFERDHTRLRDAVMAKDILALRSAWSRGKTSEARSSIGVYCLYSAIEDGHSDLAHTLLDFGFDPSPRSLKTYPINSSPLHAASSKGDLALVKNLLKHGADIRVVDGKGNTVLLPAIEAADTQNCDQQTLDLIELLLTEGVNLESLVDDGHNRVTPIRCARNRSLPKVVRILMMHGAQLSTDSYDGLSPVTSHTTSSQHQQVKLTTEFDGVGLTVVHDSEWIKSGESILRSASPARMSTRTMNSDKQSEHVNEAQQEIDEMLKQRQRMEQALKRAAQRATSRVANLSRSSKQSSTPQSVDQV